MHLLGRGLSSVDGQIQDWVLGQGPQPIRMEGPPGSRQAGTRMLSSISGHGHGVFLTFLGSWAWGVSLLGFGVQPPLGQHPPQQHPRRDQPPSLLFLMGDWQQELSLGFCHLTSKLPRHLKLLEGRWLQRPPLQPNLPSRMHITISWGGDFKNACPCPQRSPLQWPPVGGTFSSFPGAAGRWCG